MANFEKIESKEFKNIGEADSWEELYEILDEKGTVKGSGRKKHIEGKPQIIHREYSAPELKERIEKVRNGESFIDAITSGEGLRETVATLLIKDAESWEDFETKMLQLRGMEPGGHEIGYWLDMIKNVKKGLDPIHITRALGLRDKVIELKGK